VLGPLSGEHKVASVLFADVSQSFEVIRDWDEEAVDDFCTHAVRYLTEIVREFDGTVIRTLGDGILAIFGAPISCEDHAIRACLAALAILKRMPDGFAWRGHSVRFHIGLGTGPVLFNIPNSDSNGEYQLAGTTVHLASRMEKLAPPGCARMPAATAKAVSKAIKIRSLGWHSIAGLPQPIEAYEPIAVRTSGEWAATTTSGSFSPFVGRVALLRELHAAAKKAARGCLQVVALVGEPGIGKSRLSHEFIKQIDSEHWQTVRINCMAYRQQVTYGIISSIVRQILGHVGLRFDAPDASELTSALERLSISSQDVLQALRALLDFATQEDWQRKEAVRRREMITEATQDLIRAATRQRPLLVVIDDLQWIDKASEQAIFNLWELRKLPLLLLLAYRPEHRLNSSQFSEFRQLRLPPLTHTEADRILRHILGRNSAPTARGRQLAAHSGGNPLFLEELARASLHHKEEPRLLDGTAPVSIRNILNARVDRLPTREKQVIQCASVVGMSFDLTVLAELAGASGEEIQESARWLVDDGFLIFDLATSPPRCSFRHSLIQEVIYSTIPSKVRRELHAQIAVLVRSGANNGILDVVADLAYHARRGERWLDAAEYSRAAGQRALAKAANAEAKDFFEQAIECLARIDQSGDVMRLAVDLRFDLRNSLELFEPKRLIDLLTDAATIASTIGDDQRYATAAGLLSHAYWVAGRLHDAVDIGVKGMLVIENTQHPNIQATSALFAGLSYFSLGRHLEAGRILKPIAAEQKLDAALGLNVPPAVIARSYLARSLAEIGLFAESRRYVQDCQQLAQRLGSAYARGFAHLASGNLEFIEGNYTEALASFEVARQAFLECRSDVMRYTVEAFLGRVALALGQNWGFGLLRTSVRATQRLKVLVHQPQRLGFLSEAYLLTGDVARAIGAARRALRLAESQGEQTSKAYAYHQIGRALSSRSETVEEAASALRRAEGLAVQDGLVPLIARGRRDLAHALHEIGAHDEASQQEESAIAIGTKIGLHDF
jgi:class 3 adenylate cyclase/tetratricopeptide (TPR) repeat protein